MTEPVSGLMDIDLRPQFIVASTSGSSASTAITTNEQGFESSMSLFSSSNKQDLDLNSKFMSNNVNKSSISKITTNSNFLINLNEEILKSSTTTTSAKNVATASSPKVSFKIQKIFNKLEKSTENILSSSSVATTTASATGASTVSSSYRLSTESSKDTESTKKEESGQVSKELEEDGKKRPLAPVKDEEPLAKKSKSAKIDA